MSHLKRKRPATSFARLDEFVADLALSKAIVGDGSPWRSHAHRPGRRGESRARKVVRQLDFSLSAVAACKALSGRFGAIDAPCPAHFKKKNLCGQSAWAPTLFLGLRYVAGRCRARASELCCAMVFAPAQRGGMRSARLQMGGPSRAKVIHSVVGQGRNVVPRRTVSRMLDPVPRIKQKRASHEST